MQRITFTFLILAMLTFSASAADQPVRLSLTLLPATTLPGLPIGFLLTISNPSSQAKIIDDGLRLKVTSASGTFNAVNVANKNTVPLPGEQMEKCKSSGCLTVPASGQRQLYVRFGPLLVENEFFADRRLSVPGRYDLEATLYVANAPEDIEVHSDSQTLIIQQPTGVDLAVWNFLQQTSGGKGWIPTDWLDTSVSVIRQIRTAYPSSAYAAWLGAIDTESQTPFTTKLAVLDRALASSPPAAVRDELLSAKAGLLQGASDSAAFSERDIDRAVTLADQARSVLTTLQDGALTNYMVKVATGALSHLLTRAIATEEVRSLSEHDAPAPAAVVPRVECVSRGKGQGFTARFGYTNPNRAIKVLQIGSDNQVTPAPHDQGQQRVFKPGDHSNVFVGSSPGGNLIWHLDGNKATATADFPTVCAP